MIAKAVGKDGPKDNRFIAMLSLEVMDNKRPHPFPYYRFPTIGPYKDEVGVNSLGLSLQWRDQSGKWWSCRFGTAQPHSMVILSDLAKGKPAKFEDKFQQVTALIQMVHCQQCTNPSAGFYKEQVPMGQGEGERKGVEE